MGNTVKAVFPGGKVIEVERGTVIDTLTENFGALESPLAAVKVSNRIIPLSGRLEINASLEPVTVDSPAGIEIYRRSLAFLLSIAAREIFPKRRLVIGHSLGYSYYYNFEDGKTFPEEEVDALRKKMGSLVEENHPITAEYLSFVEAAEIFKKNGQADTL
ncbi:MAG: nucleoside kinase, partial [Spirochaetaceae bacterium]|nr:nucleoside kinase [Spirochaetaceae bacterium]